MWPPKFTNDPQIVHLKGHCDPLKKKSRENPDDMTQSTHILSWHLHILKREWGHLKDCKKC